LQVVVRERGPFLFQRPLGDVPVALDFKCGHDIGFYFDGLFLSDGNVAAKADDMVAGLRRLVKAPAERFVVNEAIEPQ
jgi:hypothetical protein